MTKPEAINAETAKQTKIEELNETELDQAQGAGLPIGFSKNGIAAPSDQDLSTPKGKQPQNGIISGSSA